MSNLTDKEKIEKTLQLIHKISEYRKKMTDQIVTDDSFKESSTAFILWMDKPIKEIKKVLES